MKELYESTKKFILDNYKGNIDEQVLDILTVSAMALFIRFEEVANLRLANVLNKLEIHFGNEKIADMVKERYSAYPVDEISDTTNAFVIRCLSFDDAKNYSEEWSMYVSTCGLENKTAATIGKTVHELIHLLRFNGIVESLNELKIRDGVSVARHNKTTEVTNRKHYNLEEGIVEYFTISAMNNLYDFIGDNDTSFSPALDAFKKRFKKDFKASYDVERFFLDGLTRDKRFSDLLEYSFIDQNEPISLITYYNSSVGDSSGFTKMSRSLDRSVEYANNADIDNFDKAMHETINHINGFLAKKKS